MRHEFRIEYASELNDKISEEKSNSISLVSDLTFVTRERRGIQSQQSTVVISKEEDKSKMRGLIYRIYVVEGSSVAFTLVFHPSEVAEHSFEFPITMMNVVSASSFHLQPIVSADAVRPPISLSTHYLNFGAAPIFDPDNPHSRPLILQVSITNDWKSVLDWRFDLSGIDMAVLKPDVTSGTIAQAETAMVHVSFTPMSAIPYNMHLPIFAKTDKDDSLIGNVQMIGVGRASKFSMSTTAVSLPIVPLGVKSRAMIYVINDAFVETGLKANMFVDENAFPLKVSFPDGNQLCHTVQKVPVLLTFQATRPMSFSTMVGIIGESGNATSFSVTCTTDNSVMTLYPLLNLNPDFKVSAGSGKPIHMDLNTVKAPSELMSKFMSAGDFLELGGQRWGTSYSRLLLPFIQRYLNALVLQHAALGLSERLHQERGGADTRYHDEPEQRKEDAGRSQRPTGETDR